jgi:serine/threonine protein kinase
MLPLLMSRDRNLSSGPTLAGNTGTSTSSTASTDDLRARGTSAGESTLAGVEGPPLAADEALAPGVRLGRYVLAEKLGQGGMGVVYSAHDPDLDRKVAIKVLHAGLAAQDATEGPQRLLREAQAMAKLSHPNVLTVHDVGVVGARLFIAMDLIEGCDLGRWLVERRRPWRAIVEVFIAAGAGLAAAHDAGIIHRDFKPDNVLMARNAFAFVSIVVPLGRNPLVDEFLIVEVQLTEIVPVLVVAEAHMRH